MNYEQIRKLIRQAVAETLPIDHQEDGTTVVEFRRDGPVWGDPAIIIEAITTEVMQALYPAPVSLPGAAEPIEPPQPMRGDPRVTGRWSCRCDSSKCRIEWAVGRDASTDPTQVINATCFTHGLVGRSDSARCADNPAMRQQAQALYKLDLAHAEQCR